MALLAVFGLVVFCAVAKPGLAQASITAASIANRAQSIQLPAGNQFYLYGMDTGGCCSSSSFAYGQAAAVADADGFTAAQLAFTTSDQNSFTTETSFPAIGGIAIAGRWDDFNFVYGSNNTSGASSASATFTITEDSLVAFIGLASSQQSIALSGIPSIKVDALNQGPGTVAMVLAHVDLEPGTYTVTEQSSATSAGQDPNHMVDLIGVFIFGSASESEHPVAIANVVNVASLGQVGTTSLCQVFISNVDCFSIQQNFYVSVPPEVRSFPSVVTYWVQNVILAWEDSSQNWWVGHDFQVFVDVDGRWQLSACGPSPSCAPGLVYHRGQPWSRAGASGAEVFGELLIVSTLSAGPNGDSVVMDASVGNVTLEQLTFPQGSPLRSGSSIVAAATPQEAAAQLAAQGNRMNVI